MKTSFFLIIFLISFLGLFAQSPYDTIYAVVNGNQVSIKQDNAYQNCGFRPVLEHITIDDYIINWFQVDTLGVFYGCMCFFDYTVNIDSLNPGNYTANVYSVYDLESYEDTTFEGSISFIVEQQTYCDNIIKLSSHASICHEFNELKDENMVTEIGIISYANEILINNNSSNKIVKVVLSNLSGQVVLRKSYSSSEVHLPISFLGKGVYIISVYDNHNKVSNRKIVLL